MKHKKSILIIGDMPGWAFDNIIDFIRIQLKEKFDIYYDYTIYNPRKIVKSKSDSSDINTQLLSQYKEKYLFSNVPILKEIIYKIRKKLNLSGKLTRDAEGKKRRIRKDKTYDCVVFLDFYMNIDGDFDSIKSNLIVKGIFTDGFPPKGIELDNISISSFYEQYLKDSVTLLVGAKSIANHYKDIYHSKIQIANLAYNETIFIPNHSNSETSSQLKIGWTGNPKREFKGFYQIIEPVILELQNEGYNLELFTQFSGTLNSLAEFWQNIDVAIIASEADAGPSMFMEASLCGVPSISTQIGMPSEIIQDGINGYFFNRSKEDLKQKIIDLYNNRQLLKDMSNRIREDYIPVLGEQKQKTNWIELFNNLFNESEK